MAVISRIYVWLVTSASTGTWYHFSLCLHTFYYGTDYYWNNRFYFCTIDSIRIKIIKSGRQNVFKTQIIKKFNFRPLKWLLDEYQAKIDGFYIGIHFFFLILRIVIRSLTMPISILFLLRFLLFSYPSSHIE